MYRSSVNSIHVLEYIWVGGNGELRSKTRVLDTGPLQKITIHDVPLWNYDGSSTNQAPSNANTEVILKPVKLYNDPLRKRERETNDNNKIQKRSIQSYIVLCETYDNSNNPLPTNTRHKAFDIFSDIENMEHQPWFGLEQEYIIVYKELLSYTNPDIYLNKKPNHPDHYCGTMTGNIYRTIVDEHLQACIDAGLNISGINAEVTKHQWEFQIGPCEGIDAGDELYVARYLLERIANKYDMMITYEPKFCETLNGSGCHTNFSTKKMREENGMEEILKCMDKLREKHHMHMEVYGKNNEKRLTGMHETAPYGHFTYGIGTRNTSVRIGNQTEKDGRGYFEDRRPAANMDPYLVTTMLFETCCLSP
jgi:glutamine synthetase